MKIYGELGSLPGKRIKANELYFLDEFLTNRFCLFSAALPASSSGKGTLSSKTTSASSKSSNVSTVSSSLSFESLSQMTYKNKVKKSFGILRKVARVNLDLAIRGQGKMTGYIDRVTKDIDIHSTAQLRVSSQVRIIEWIEDHQVI